jgi:ABC-2 type transport system permease protein
MNVEQNEAIGSSRKSSAGSTAPFPSTRLLFWSIRREFWENRQIYLAPLAVAGLVLAGFLVHTMGSPPLAGAPALDPGRLHKAIVMPYDLAAALIMGTTAIVSILYCLDALQGERRDRSILFWKSLPVSDLTTVLAKASIPIVFMQLVSFAITVVMQLGMLLESTAALSARGLSAGALWTEVSLPRTSLLLFYHLFAVHALWYAPIYAWLILVSAWSRRAAILWAFLPPLAIGVLEKMIFGTSRLKALLENRVMAGMEAVATPGAWPMDPMTHVTPGRFLASPGLWIGLAIAACLLAAAARIRRYRGPI